MFLNQKRKRVDDDNDEIREKKRIKKSFPLTDKLLTDHLFNSIEPFISKLGNEFQIDNNIENPQPKKSAWVDEHSEALEIKVPPTNEVFQKLLKNYIKKNNIKGSLKGKDYEKCMREIYMQLNPIPDWWKNVLKNPQQKVNEILQTTEELISKNLEFDFVRQTNLNISEYPSKKSHIISLEFHPKFNFAQTCSSDNVIRIYSVDGKSNPLIGKFYNFKKITLSQSSWSKDGKYVIVGTKSNKYFSCEFSSSKKFEHSIGNDYRTSWSKFCLSNDNEYIAFANDNKEIIDLISMETYFSIQKFHTSEKILDLTFSPDSNYLFCVTIACKIYVWDLKKKRPINVMQDYSSIGTTKICVSPDSNFISTGCSSGIVNIYNYDIIFKNNKRPKAMKSLNNVTTGIDILNFSKEGSLLCCGSSVKEDKIRLFKIPTFKCLQNFPNYGKLGKDKIFRCFKADFSHGDDFLAISLKRRVFLYKIFKI